MDGGRRCGQLTKHYVLYCNSDYCFNTELLSIYRNNTITQTAALIYCLGEVGLWWHYSSVRTRCQRGEWENTAGTGVTVSYEMTVKLLFFWEKSVFLTTLEYCLMLLGWYLLKGIKNIICSGQTQTDHFNATEDIPQVFCFCLFFHGYSSFLYIRKLHWVMAFSVDKTFKLYFQCSYIL